MIKIFALTLFWVTSAFALDAVVTVLETPMLQEEDINSKVVQYLRKGDVIKIHPSVGNDPKWDQYSPFGEDPFRDERDFIPTLDRQGNTVYLIREHIYIYYEDPREFKQVSLKKDPTDYRLEEPLPKNYPLKHISGYRGQLILGLTQHHYESYAYPENPINKGYKSPFELGITLLRTAPGNYSDRLFIGGSLNIKSFENSFLFSDQRLSKEQGLKFGVGPTISYDAYKGEKNRVNISSTVVINLIDRLTISQFRGSIGEERLYMGYSFVPKVAIQYHRKGVLEDIDFVLGSNFDLALPSKLDAKDGAGNEAWWNNLGNDEISNRLAFSMGFYLGIQSAY